MPNALGPIIVDLTINLSAITLQVSSLSYIGLGVQPPTPEWGVLLSEAREYMQIAPHTILFPGIAIMLTALAFNLIGDGLREYIRGGAHPDENLWGEEDADQSHDDGEDKPQGNRHMNGSFYIFIIFSPDIVGNDDAGTDGDAVEETDHHEDEIAGGGYGGEGVTSDEITDNQRIRGVIELLEEIAEEEW